MYDLDSMMLESNLDSNIFSAFGVVCFRGDTLEIKGSKFMTYLCHIDSINYKNTHKIFLASLKVTHKKAVHFVECFRILNNLNQIIEHSSDDGEPKGSSGVPMLEVLRGENVINTLCICVRYFGGVKLGIGGLVRAYTQSSLDSIKKAKGLNIFKEFKQNEVKIIESKSANYNKMQHFISKNHIEILKKEFDKDNMILTLSGGKVALESFLATFCNAIKNL